MTLVDNFFPFDTGAGAGATPARWRLMARTWATSGILPKYLNQMAPTIAGSVVTVDTGAIWIDGFYGESNPSKNIAVSGSGMVVVRADPNSRQIVIAFVPNQTVPTQSLTDIYEVPICRVAAGAITDIRQFTSASGIPSGVMWDFAGGTPPVGWLLCDGTSYLRSDYAPLFTAISTVYGAVDGTHFNVPDTRGCVLVGSGTGAYAGATAHPLGQRGGEEAHTLSTAELASHIHGVYEVPHTHGVSGDVGFRIVHSNSGSNEGLTKVNLNTPATMTSLDRVSTGLSVQANGSSGAHNNMQPFLAVSKIIKA